MTPPDTLIRTPDATQSRDAAVDARQTEVAQLGVSMVVPVFNERECVTPLLETLVNLDLQFAERFRFEMILVDDGSSDNTAELLEEATVDRENFRVVRHATNLGIAGAIHTGIVEAENEVVVSIDADGSYDVSLVGEMVPRLVDGVDMVTASPYHPAGGIQNVPRWRLWISRLASSMYWCVMRSDLYCYTSCFRVYRREAVLGLQPRNPGYVGVAELLWKVERNGGRVVEHPAVLSSRVAGHSKMRIFRAGMQHMRLILNILHDRFFGRL